MKKALFVDITFNTTDGPFKDVNLRKAVAYAINREELGKAVLRDTV